MPDSRPSRVAAAASIAGALAAASLTLAACGGEASLPSASRNPAPTESATASPAGTSSRASGPLRVGVPFALGSARVLSNITALGPGNDGAARFATVAFDDRGTAPTMVVAARIGERLTPARRLIAGRQSARVEAATFLPDGTTLVVAGSPDHEQIDATQVDADGRASPRVRVSAPSGGSGWPKELATAPVVGPSGAVAEVFTQSLAGGYRGPVLAFRPAGPTAYGTPIPLAAGEGSEEESYTVAMSPDGGAFVIGVPAFGAGRLPFARHISPDGTPGPVVDLGTAALGFHGGVADGYLPTDAVVTPAGTLTVAMSLPTPNVGDRRGSPTLAVASMAPGAEKASAFKLGAGVSDDNARPVLSIAVDGDDEVALLARDGHRGLSVYEGSAASRLTRTSSIRAPAASVAELFGDPSGSLQVVWLRQSETGSPRARFMATSRSPGGVLDPPHALSDSRLARGSIDLARIARLPGGQVALAYVRSADRQDEDDTWFGLITQP